MNNKYLEKEEKQMQKILKKQTKNKIKKYKSNYYGVLKKIIMRKKAFETLYETGKIYIWIEAKYYDKKEMEKTGANIESLYLKMLQKYNWAKEKERKKHAKIKVVMDKKKYESKIQLIVEVGEINGFINEEGDKTRVRLDLVDIKE